MTFQPRTQELIDEVNRVAYFPDWKHLMKIFRLPVVASLFDSKILSYINEDEEVLSEEQFRELELKFQTAMETFLAQREMADKDTLEELEYEVMHGNFATYLETTKDEVLYPYIAMQRNQSPFQDVIDSEKAWVGVNGRNFVATKVGCGDYLTVFANRDVILGPIPSFIEVDGFQVPVRVLRADGFLALRAVMTPVLDVGPNAEISQYSLDLEWRFCSFLLLICKDSPFNLVGYKLIIKPPAEEWDVSGGLQNMTVSNLILQSTATPVVGVGTRLMHGVLALARSFKCKVVKIHSASGARDFYKKLGFVRIDKKMMQLVL